MAQCQNCHTELTGPFCSNCGQSSEVERLKVGTLFNLAASHLFDLDSKIFRTFLDLISRPGEAIRDYILGKRKLYVNPVNYYLISGTLIILLTTWFPRNFIEIADNFSPDLSTMDPEKAAIVLQSQRELMQFVIDHFRLINMLIYLCLPLFLSVFFRYKKYGYSTVDYYVFILFCASQINFISAPLHIIGYYFDFTALNAFSIMVMPFYILYAGFGLFKKLTGWMIIKLILATVLSFLVYTVILAGSFMFVLVGRLNP